MKDQLTLLQRLQSPTPKFFQLAFKAGAAIAVVAAMLTAGHDELTNQGVPVPNLLAKAIEVVGYISAGIASISKFAIRSES
jgi:hypothetical protein